MTIFKKDDILVEVFNFSMTLVTFYKVVDVNDDKGSIKIQKMTNVETSTGDRCGTCVPDLNSTNGHIFEKDIVDHYNGESCVVVGSPDYQKWATRFEGRYATLWDNKSISYDHCDLYMV